MDNKEIQTYPTKPYSEIDRNKQTEINKKEQIKKDKYNNFQSSLIYYGTLKQQYIEKLKNKTKK